MESIYLKIKSIRIEKKLTQEDVAKRLGMAQGNYARMERGLSQLTIERLQELADIFEMTPEAIIGYTGEETDFKEDAQFYYNQVKRLEAKIKKLEDENQQLMQEDEDSSDRRNEEKKEHKNKIQGLRDQISFRDSVIKDKQALIDKLEKEMENKDRLIDHLKESNAKLLDSTTKLLDRLQS